MKNFLRSVLFICKGNVCRSPFAARLAEKRGLFERIGSAGHLGSSGRPAPPEAIEAARVWGLDLTAHRSRAVTAEMLQEADLVFVFDQENAAALRERFPQEAEAARLLGGGKEIADPWGRGRRVFEECYQEIADALGALKLDETA